MVQNQKNDYHAMAETFADCFDSAWYLEVNPDVKTSGMDPYVHFLQFGLREGRFPNRDCQRGTAQKLAYLLSAPMPVASQTAIKGIIHYITDDHISRRMIINQAPGYQYAKLQSEDFSYGAARILRPAPYAPNIWLRLTAQPPALEFCI